MRIPDADWQRGRTAEPSYELENSKNKAKVISVINVIKHIESGIKLNRPRNIDGDVNKSLKGAMDLTNLIKVNGINRADLWEYVHSKDFRVKKVAIWGLGYPKDEAELEMYWREFYNSEDDYTGVREAWIYMIVGGSKRQELDKWISLVEDKNIDVRLCVKIFLERYYKDAPKLEHSPDQNMQMIHKFVEPVLKWYKGVKEGE